MGLGVRVGAAVGGAATARQAGDGGTAGDGDGDGAAVGTKLVADGGCQSLPMPVVTHVLADGCGRSPLQGEHEQCTNEYGSIKIAR